MSQKKFLIAVNHNMEKHLKTYFEKEMGLPADVFYMDSIGEKSKIDSYRHFTYMRVAIKTFMHRNSYDSIIFWQQFIGLYYGLITRILFFLPTRPKSVVLTLIYIKRAGIKGKIYHHFFKFMLMAKAINKAVIHSEVELELYKKVFNLTEDKLAFEEVGDGEPSVYNKDYHDPLYFFSGGGSQRDYRTLIEAFSQTNLKLKIACLPNHVRGIKIPPNVELIHNAWHSKFDKLIAGSYAVLLTVKDPNISAGQLVLIKSMRLSKPVIVTAGNCMKDYTTNTMSFSVNAKSKSEIINAVNLLIADLALRDNMSKAAFDLYGSKFTHLQYIKRVCSLLK